MILSGLWKVHPCTRTRARPTLPIPACQPFSWGARPWADVPGIRSIVPALSLRLSAHQLRNRPVCALQHPPRPAASWAARSRANSMLSRLCYLYSDWARPGSILLLPGPGPLVHSGFKRLWSAVNSRPANVSGTRRLTSIACPPASATCVAPLLALQMPRTTAGEQRFTPSPYALPFWNRRRGM